MSLFRSFKDLLSSSANVCHVQKCLVSSYFSVTRNRQGRSEVEIKKQLGIPEPPATEIPHCRRDIRIAPKKMTLVANLVARMSIEDAITQCEFSNKGAAAVVKEVLEEAQEVAVKKYGIDDKTNLYVDQSHVGRGQHLKRIKFHGRGRFGKMKRFYCHYFCVLKEGVPPGKDVPRVKTRYLTELERKLKHPKTIKNSLAWW